jgi:DNA polymerase sigma
LQNLKAFSLHSGNNQDENGSSSTLNSQALPKSKDKVKKERINSAGDGISKEIGLKKTYAHLPKRAKEFVLKTNITQFINTLIREGSTLKLSAQIDRICTMLQKQIAFKYPKIKVYPFGSVVVGLGSKGSDLDLFVDIDGCFYNRLSKRKMKDAIFNVQRVLSNNFPAWDKFEPVIHARTPILRAFCAAEKIDCDLSFSNGLSTCNTKLIQYFMDLQPICKQIVLFVKYWAHQLTLGVNSYMITLMVIFYLQQETLLPTVRSLQESARNEEM